MIDLKNLTIEKAHSDFKSGNYTAVELVGAYLEEIKERDQEINAYIEIYEDAIDQAKEADKIIKSGKASLLTGIPISLKDVILIKGRNISAGSKILENYVATYDAYVVEKLKAKGAVFIGRTNMDEFAMGASTENSAFGVTKNPHDETRVPGGSSGGAAASVAMNGALVALGSDTGGSVRQPSSFCGVVGLKPTYGTISRRGLIAMGSSLDQIGTIGKSVRDAEILFDVIRGHDEMDSTSLNDREGSDDEIKTIGVPWDFVDAKGVDPSILENFKSTIKKMEDAGYEIKDIKIPHIKYSLASYYIVMPAEASTNLARFDGIRFGLRSEGENLLEEYTKTRGVGFGKEVRRRILLGTHVLSSGYYDAYYGKAMSTRDLLRKDFESAFNEVDVIATPTTPTPAFKIGEKSDDPLAMYLADIFTVSVNLTGNPAISIPSGFVDIEGKKLPLGFQFIAPDFCENRLFKMGKEIEKIVS